MKKITREISWVCLPLILVGGGFGVWRALHPPLDPNAKIKLTVQQKQLQNQEKEAVWLAWESDVSGGPTPEFTQVYSQAVWAIGGDWKTQISALPTSNTMPITEIGNVSNGWTPRGWNSVQRSTQMQEIRVPIADIPPGTRKLEWRGQFVVAPSKKNAGWSPGSAAKLRQIAQIPGAVTRDFTISVPLTPEQISPIYALRTHLVPGTKSNFLVTYALKDEPRAIHQKLTAFDGKEYRPLWDGQISIAKPNAYWDGTGDDVIYGQNNAIYTYKFDLSGVPKNEGVLFNIDVVYAPKNSSKSPVETEKNVSLPALKSLEKQGWTRGSHQILVRPRS